MLPCMHASSRDHKAEEHRRGKERLKHVKAVLVATPQLLLLLYHARTRPCSELQIHMKIWYCRSQYICQHAPHHITSHAPNPTSTRHGRADLIFSVDRYTLRLYNIVISESDFLYTVLVLARGRVRCTFSIVSTQTQTLSFVTTYTRKEKIRVYERKKK